MKVVIFCGGNGIWLNEKKSFTPKALIPLHGKPLIYSILKHFIFYGHHDFLLLTGRGHDLIVDFVDDCCKETLFSDINIKVLPTGESSNTGQRLWIAKDHLKEEKFILTYSDIISDINISKLVNTHNSYDRILTMAGAFPNNFLGIIDYEGNIVKKYSVHEKMQNAVKAGFFVCDPKIFEMIETCCDNAFEEDALSSLIEKNQVTFYGHYGNWKHFESTRQIVEMNNVDLDEKPSWNIFEEF